MSSLVLRFPTPFPGGPRRTQPARSHAQTERDLRRHRHQGPGLGARTRSACAQPCASRNRAHACIRLALAQHSLLETARK
eukprot:scaffold155273_cov20-Tisochrysis_lutea.AAC.3